MTTVWFEGIEALNTIEADLGKAGTRASLAGIALVRSTALAIEGTAKSFVPVDTGATKNSIGTDFPNYGIEHAFEAAIGPTTAWAPYLEYGTSKMAPHAFMGPALDRHSGAFVAAAAELADPLP